ncbi:MAG: hypothetical protein ABS43_01780 [Bordetella sp. SCN 67-23]|nr:hypothetical protein [Burkholderiales bacterium]ODS76300.1 MAG: hypothetical protein ABS43_01780 [Bordetella sp. SCN 67-23]OJW90103.1 MAG: hypothetical protein BGO71_27715 [Burkholderiales bacterium 67-32]
MRIVIQYEGKSVELESIATPLPGPEHILGDVRLAIPAALYVDILAYNEQVEALSAGSLAASAFGRARIQLIYRTLLRNWPELPEGWVRAHLDIENIDTLQAAVLRQGVSPGEGAAESA